MNLDSDTAFNAAIKSAMDLGIAHVASGKKKLAEADVVAAVAARLGCGPIRYRRFHGTIISRAYGLPFVNKVKMAWVEKNGDIK